MRRRRVTHRSQLWLLQSMPLCVPAVPRQPVIFRRTCTVCFATNQACCGELSSLPACWRGSAVRPQKLRLAESSLRATGPNHGGPSRASRALAATFLSLHRTHGRMDPRGERLRLPPTPAGDANRVGLFLRPGVSGGGVGAVAAGPAAAARPTQRRDRLAATARARVMLIALTVAASCSR